MYNLMSQPGTMQQQQQFVSTSGFSHFEMDPGSMAREPMPGYVDEMSAYFTSTSHLMAESLSVAETSCPTASVPMSPTASLSRA